MSLSSIKAKPAWMLSGVAIGLLTLLIAITPGRAQNSSQNQQSQQNQQQTQDNQQAPPAAGGPGGDIGPIAVPKKKPEDEKPPERAPKVKNPEEIGTFSLKVDVPLVNLPVSVITGNGQFIPGLKADNFRVLEDGIPQKIDTFSQQGDKPITAVLLIEFAANSYAFMYDALNAAYSFTGQMKKDDWIAVESYDMKTHLLVDFTQDKSQVMGALGQLRIPGFSETNLFDALYDTIDRLEGVEGQKYILLICNGIDTFSKLTYDKVLKKIQGSKNITIFCVGTGQAFRLYLEAAGYLGPLRNLDFLQADNQLNTFAKMTGGRAYFPRFTAEFPEDFADIASDIRNQYVLTYRPTNTKQDGSWRKLKVDIVDPQTGAPLIVQDQHKKKLKYQVVARDGYKAKNEVD
ncbi:MAG: VWA domain-containing protein [Acidobacteria bacterium]|nr:VWA domain-containing protein [Acidobacteriota bacterium]MBV9434926.1 VWA domain-containing protein [Acidobacteriota bacterium]